jgi:16S rRNA (cytosine1402-N4)-methyltransferase
MRFDRRQTISAAHILNTYSQNDIERIIREYGEERHWRAISREIVKRREVAPFQTTKELLEIVRSIVGERFLNKSLARVFQALRIEVNQELRRLQDSLETAFRFLKEGGRLVVISYHSLEDRIVKEFFREKNLSCVCPPELPTCVCDKVQEVGILTRRPVVPDETEIWKNPRSRSAKLRAAKKIIPFREGKA